MQDKVVSAELIKEVETQMLALAEELRFEEAADLREKLLAMQGPKSMSRPLKQTRRRKKKGIKGYKGPKYRRRKSGS